jgi:hypothetical protein
MYLLIRALLARSRAGRRHPARQVQSVGRLAVPWPSVRRDWRAPGHHRRQPSHQGFGPCVYVCVLIVFSVRGIIIFELCYQLISLSTKVSKFKYANEFKENGTFAVVAACAAGGMGHAMLIERYA